MSRTPVPKRLSVAGSGTVNSNAIFGVRMQHGDPVLTHCDEPLPAISAESHSQLASDAWLKIDNQYVVPLAAAKGEFDQRNTM